MCVITICGEHDKSLGLTFLFNIFKKFNFSIRYRNGDAVTATQVYYERVNSHSSGNVFLYDSCGYKVHSVFEFKQILIVISLRTYLTI